MSPALEQQPFRSEKVNYLTSFSKGEKGTVVEIITEPALQGRLMGMGLFTGTQFQLIQGGRGSHLPLILAVGETRIALGIEIAQQILVE
jgi:Fe2+ transport system protein FeoA